MCASESRPRQTQSRELIGPFRQLVSMAGLANAGPLRDRDLVVLEDAGLSVEVDGGRILEVGAWSDLVSRHPDAARQTVEGPAVAFPGLIDCHTHLCWAGNRADEYAQRLAGVPYLDIARQGGGIMRSVRQARAATLDELTAGTLARARILLRRGVTTIEVKSGYGLDTEAELRILEAIAAADRHSDADLIATCLAAHVPPHDDGESSDRYLDRMASELLPRVAERSLAERVDIFVEETAFAVGQARRYLKAARELGFELTVHADQFSSGGAMLAAELGAQSADHLESSTREDLRRLGESNVVAVALPGASLGLGEPWTDARAVLDTGGTLAIASDWNPGSAPMGHLLLQAALLGTYRKLSMAETWAGVTVRAALALGLRDRGVLEAGRLADLVAWPIEDWREVLYSQGAIEPIEVWKRGRPVG